MLKFVVGLSLFWVSFGAGLPQALVAAEEGAVTEVVLGVHGGTASRKAKLTPEQEQAVRTDLTRASRRGT